jgi:hypothetical protein
LKDGLTCREAIKRAILELGGGPVTAEELFNKVRSMGDWSNDTIWQHLMWLVVNLSPAYRHWPNAPERFLFLREDGKYEHYDPEKHGIYSNGLRIRIHPDEECNRILEKYMELITKLKTYITKLFTMKPISVAEVSTKYQDKTGVYIFFSDGQVEYIGSTNNLYRRLKHDLWGSLGQPQQPHVFGRKILREHGNVDEARSYLRSLKLKVIETEDLETARVLEQILIYLLKPRYNNYGSRTT